MTYPVKSIFGGKLGKKVLEKTKINGWVYSSELADELNRDQSMISGILANLEEIGFLEKNLRTRAQYYSLTEKGHRYLDLLDTAEELESLAEIKRSEAESLWKGDSSEE